MANATTYVKVNYSSDGKVIYIYSRMTPTNSSGREYIYAYRFEMPSGVTIQDNIYAYFTVDGAYLDNYNASAEPATVNNVGTHKDSGEGTVAITNADGMVICNEYGKTTPIADGQTLTWTATPADKYAFKQWTNGDTSNPRQIVLDGSNDKTPYVMFVTGKQINFSELDFSDNTGTETSTLGSVTATVDGSPISLGSYVAPGKQVVFTANINEAGTLLYSWKVGTEYIWSTLNPYTVTVDDETSSAYTIKAVLTSGIDITANANNTALGSVSISQFGINYGTTYHTTPYPLQIVFTATPENGIQFEGWYNNADCTGTAISTDNPYKPTEQVIGNANHTLYAKFSIPAGTYTLTWDKTNIPTGCDAWFTIGEDNTEYRKTAYIAGEKTIHLHATDNVQNMIFSCYKIGEESNWKWNEKDINLTVSTDVTIEPYFSNAFTATAVSDGTCTVEVTAHNTNPEGKYNINGTKQKVDDNFDKITFTATAEDGMTFNGWYNGDTEVSTSNPFEATSTNNSDYFKKDVTLEARYTIPAPIGGNRIKALLQNIGTGSLDKTVTTTDPETGKETVTVHAGTWANGVLKTENTTYNHVDIFRFSQHLSSDKTNVDNASNYTGIRFTAGKVDDATPITPFRVLVYLNGITNPRITTFSDASCYAFTWSDLGVAAGEVSNIERIAFAGQQNGATNVKFSDVWIEKIDDQCHTIVTYGDVYGVYGGEEAKTYTYTHKTPEGNVTAVFSGIDGGSRRGYQKEIKLENDLVITAPTGKYIKAVKMITNAAANQLVFTSNRDGLTSGYAKTVTNGNEVVYTTGNNSNSVTVAKAAGVDASIYIAKIEVVYNNDDVKHPALTKYAAGIYTADLSKLKADGYGSVAYDEETSTVYNSNNATYCGNVYLEFETPQDFTYLTKLTVNYDGDKIGNVINFLDSDGNSLKDYYSYSNADAEGNAVLEINETDRALLVGVKKIQFNNGTGVTGAMKLDYIGFDISHIDPKVAIDCAEVITVNVGQKFTLKGHATAGENGPNSAFWRQYNEAKTVASEISGIKDYEQWVSELTLTATQEGTFYYGIRASQNCVSTCPNYNSEYKGSKTSDPVFVKVIVEKNNIYEALSLNFEGNTYDDNKDNTVDPREYRVYVPQSILNGTDADKKDVPVVFSLHGTGNDYDPSAGGVQDFNELAENEKFIVVYPRGRQYLPGLWGRGWEATGSENEDTKFFDAIIADLSSTTPRTEYNQENKKFTIDKKRIYVTGYSNGGMMAYALANCKADTYAAFSSISGIPVNEMHLRHHGTRPVPFMHIHGTKDSFVKYSHMPTIVDNMIFRNGCDITPKVTQGSSRATTSYKRNEYTGGAFPYIYYEVGTGMTTADTGMGHDYQCTIDGDDSKELFWKFMKDYTLDSTCDTNLEFEAKINTANNAGREHGWETNSGALIVAQYGESGGYSVTGENVYHSIQLNAAKHYLSFNISSTDENNYVVVRLTKIGDLSNFNTFGKNSYPLTNVNVINDVAYKAEGGTVCIEFDTTDYGAGEYMLNINKSNRWANVTISDIKISKTGTPTNNKYEDPISTDFTGYFNYNNRLFAQWNFDNCDGYRFDGQKINSYIQNNDNDYWRADLTNTDYVPANGSTAATPAKNGTIIFTYTKPLGTQGESVDYTNADNYAQLTYNGSTEIVPVTAGLKFNAPANCVKVYVDLVNGQVTGTHLVVDEDVKLLVPYVENSYRNDKNSDSSDASTLADFQNCMHHIKRDILYVALNEGSFWDHINNVCIDQPGNKLFHSGGDEYVNSKNYTKGDYMGTNGVPCVLQFTKSTVIDRIGVNRNLTYSFYTEYIQELGYQKPYPGMRIVGSPSGAKVANIGDSFETYNNVCAMTYGGWTNSSYSTYDGNTTTDTWDDLGVFNGQATEGKGSVNVGDDVWMNYGNVGNVAASNVTAAIDGFPIVTKSFSHAKSEALMPSSTTDNVYHPANPGNLNIGNYTPNITPWSLPCRGAYGKYEVSYPGVLNADVVMKGNNTKYYIADEFGKPIKQAVFCRTAQGSTNPVTKRVDENVIYYTVPKTDYVKFSFNVYPGKTYYIFSNEAGLGITGFYFEPLVYRYDTHTEATAAGKDFEYGRYDVRVEELTLKDTESFCLPTDIANGRTIYLTSPTNSGTTSYPVKFSKDAVKVKLNRSFTAGQWNSICVPYSINKAQMDHVFGEGTEVILMRDIQKGSNGLNNTQLNFITHANQDIIAGYPYFIKPTKEVSKVETYACFTEEASEMNSITSVGTNTASGETLSGVGGYSFVGTFAPNTKMNAGSYYLSGGSLYMAKKEYTMKGYRAWLQYDETEYNKNSAKVSRALVNDIEEIDMEDTATGIEELDFEDVLLDHGILSKQTNIYSINGQVVRTNTTDLRNLPKGIYIINGKKYIAK